MQGLEFVDCCIQAAKLHYCLANKKVLMLDFKDDKENVVVMPDGRVKNKCSSNLWLRG